MESATETFVLNARREPRQARSRRRVNEILDAVAELLVERGFDAITTRLIAQKAKIPVGSIYQFFPNKFAILHALAFRYLEGFEKVFDQGITPALRGRPWEEQMAAVIDAVAKFWSSEKAIPILWAGIQNSPELQAAESRTNQEAVRQNLVLLDRLLPHIEPQRRRLIGRVMAQVCDALLCLASRQKGPRKGEAEEELKFLLTAYIRAHIDAGERTPAPQGHAAEELDAGPV